MELSSEDRKIWIPIREKILKIIKEDHLKTVKERWDILEWWAKYRPIESFFTVDWRLLIKSDLPYGPCPKILEDIEYIPDSPPGLRMVVAMQRKILDEGKIKKAKSPNEKEIEDLLVPGGWVGPEPLGDIDKPFWDISKLWPKGKYWRTRYPNNGLDTWLGNPEHKRGRSPKEEALASRWKQALSLADEKFHSFWVNDRCRIDEPRRKLKRNKWKHPKHQGYQISSVKWPSSNLGLLKTLEKPTLLPFDFRFDESRFLLLPIQLLFGNGTGIKISKIWFKLWTLTNCVYDFARVEYDWYCIWLHEWRKQLIESQKIIIRKNRLKGKDILIGWPTRPDYHQNCGGLLIEALSRLGDSHDWLVCDTCSMTNVIDNRFGQSKTGPGLCGFYTIYIGSRPQKNKSKMQFNSQEIPNIPVYKPENADFNQDDYGSISFRGYSAPENEPVFVDDARGLTYSERKQYATVDYRVDPQTGKGRSIGHFMHYQFIRTKFRRCRGQFVYGFINRGDNTSTYCPPKSQGCKGCKYAVETSLVERERGANHIELFCGIHSYSH